MDIIEKGQIPLRKELVDRYDLVFVFKALRYRDKKVEYAKQKLELLRKSQGGEIIEDYTFLRKIIEYAKSFNPQLSEEAEAMIVDFWPRLDSNIFPTNRVLETIVRVSMAFARLHFSNIVTAEIAKEAIDFLRKMFEAFDETVMVVEDPRDATCREITKFLQESPGIPYEFQELINHAGKVNTLVEAYLGKGPINNNNSKYRDIADRFRQGMIGKGLISIQDMNPLTLIFKPEARKNTEGIEKEEEEEEKNVL